MKRIIIAMACTSVLALSACGGSDDSASKATDSAKSAASSGASAATSAASSTTTSASSPSSSPDPASPTSSAGSPTSPSSSASGSGAAAGGSTVKAAKFATAPAVVGRWKIAKTVAPTSTSAVYNDGTGVGANYDVSDSLSEADARQRITTQISTIPGGFCGVGAADNALCFLKTDKGGMVTASATASDAKDNIKVSKEFAQALYAVTK